MRIKRNLVKQIVYTFLFVMAFSIQPVTMAYSQVTSGGGQVTTEGQIHFISEDSADESKPEGPEDGNDNGRLPATGGVVRSLGFWLGVLLLFIGYLFMKKRQKEVD